MLCSAQRKPDPPRDEDAEHVSMRKQSDIAANNADPGDDSIYPCAHLLWHFAAWAAVAEYQPFWCALVDLFGRQPLVFAVVPLDQIGVDDSRVAETRQFAGLSRASHWA